jgi:hypothetical protein
LYYGGRGSRCKPCESAGDSATTIGMALGGLAFMLFCAVLVGTICRRRVTKWIVGVVGIAASVGGGNAEDALREAAIEKAERGAAKKGKFKARLVSMLADLGVKSRILISLCQVLGQVSTTYSIRFPSVYDEVLGTMASINLPVKALPFGCTFPNLDNYMFDLVLKTAAPLGSSL